MTACIEHVVVTNANVLINLMHVGRLSMCTQLPNLKFVIPDHVHAEITDPAQRPEVDAAITRGDFRVESITAPDSIALYAE